MTAQEQLGLGELVERVKAATGADRELDCRIGYATSQPIEAMMPFRDYCELMSLDWPKIADMAERHQSILSHNLPRFSASIDAALALTERMLPGWKWNVGMDALDEVHATIWHGVTEEDHYAATPPLAILASLLTALSLAEGKQP